MSLFTEKRTPEEARKEMEELTKKELSALNEKIIKNPSILKPMLNYDSDSSSSYSLSSSSSSSSAISYKKSKKYPNIEVIKQESKIDKLAEKNYYKTLELSNLMLENTKLKDLNNALKIKSDEREKLFNLLKEILEFTLNDRINNKDLNFDILSSDNIIYKSIELQKSFNEDILGFETFVKKTNELPDTIIKSYFSEYITHKKALLEKNYQLNTNKINNFLLILNIKDKCLTLIILLLSLFFAILIKDAYNLYFS
jgi:hypothetical protein